MPQGSSAVTARDQSRFQETRTNAFTSSNIEIKSADLSQYFDAVVMLTWSDWKTEPRSNRYHYATRFARTLPVLFVQQWAPFDAPLEIEPSGFPNIDLVQTTSAFGQKQVEEILELLQLRGIRRPLLWIYNSLHYQPLIDALPNALRIYHATEDYLTPSFDWDEHQQLVAKSVLALLPQIDLLVGVSEAVIRSYQRKGGYRGAVVLAENGCDSEFFFKILDNRRGSRPHPRPVAIYQGGINRRLDFGLLGNLVHSLPDWDFWFCGGEDESIEEWRKLKGLPNVRYWGKLAPEQFAERMCEATIGLIPFTQCEGIENSLPLKAFEYVACGLSVVTVPITALKQYPDLFTPARTAEEFAQAMQTLAPTHDDPDALAHRREGAAAHSYDRQFANVCARILQERERMQNRLRKLNVAILYGERDTHISTIYEHLNAFRSYSHHQIYFIPATINFWTPPPIDDAHDVSFHTDLSLFDVVIVHYGVRLSLPEHINAHLAEKLARYNGLKMLFIQDEYDTTEIARSWMEKLQFDVVYTNVPEEDREFVYPKRRLPTTEFLPTLTGYVPEDPHIDNYALPLGQREIVIGYRGRMLPYFYGDLGHEKYQIGVEVKRLAEERGIPVDIEVDDSKRIYGADWYRFLGSTRATIGTESGSNIFDFDGKLKEAVTQALAENPGRSFQDIHREFLAEHEGIVKMNQISPKIFEAIRLHTALVLFEGAYSGVVKPDLHYIPLKKDFSNIDEVFKKLEDLDYLRQLTERAYKDIIESGTYSYRRFVEGIDADIAARTVHNARYELFAYPMVAQRADGAVKSVAPLKGIGYCLNTGIMKGSFQREQMAELIDHHKFRSSFSSLNELKTRMMAALIPWAPPKLRQIVRIRLPHLYATVRWGYYRMKSVRQQVQRILPHRSN